MILEFCAVEFDVECLNLGCVLQASQSKADEDSSKAEVLRKAAALGIRLPFGYQRRWAKR